MKSLLLGCIWAVILPLSAQAQTYEAVQADKSHIHFSYKQMGVSMQGSFERFESRLAFDPQAPAGASASIKVDLSSIDVGYPEGNEEIVRPEWLDSATHPVATFVLASITPDGEGVYQASGKLRIKQGEHIVRFPVRLTTLANAIQLDGTFTIARAQFGIGTGQWAGDDVVARDVVIEFRITAAKSGS